MEDFGLIEIETETDEKGRENCERCLRPVKVCLCEYIVSPKIKTSCSVVIIQHPLEVKRPLRTVPLLEAALESCHVFRTRKLSDPSRLPKLVEILSTKKPFVLFPSDQAIPCHQLPPDSAIIAIDGTWRQARGMLHNSKYLQSLPHCCVKIEKTTEYVIRTQPEEGYVSTLEALAAAVASAEKNEDLYTLLTRPLRAMCDIQLAHGALVHDSKQKALAEGTWKGDRPISNRNKLNREQKLIEQYQRTKN